MSNPPLAIGIDFGGTTVKFGVVAGAAVMETADSLPTQSFPDPPSLIDAIVSTVQQLRSRHQEIAAVGIGLPGFVDFQSGLVHSLTNVPGWVNIPMREEFARRCDLPCQIDNDANAMKNMGMIPDGAVVNHFLTDTDAFFIKTDAPNGFKMFNRSPIKSSMEGDFDTGNMRFKARERYSFGVSDWRCVFGTPGA